MKGKVNYFHRPERTFSPIQLRKQSRKTGFFVSRCKNKIKFRDNTPQGNPKSQALLHAVCLVLMASWVSWRCLFFNVCLFIYMGVEYIAFPTPTPFCEPRSQYLYLHLFIEYWISLPPSLTIHFIEMIIEAQWFKGLSNRTLSSCAFKNQLSGSGDVSYFSLKK